MRNVMLLIMFFSFFVSSTYGQDKEQGQYMVKDSLSARDGEAGDTTRVDLTINSCFPGVDTAWGMLYTFERCDQLTVTNNERVVAGTGCLGSRDFEFMLGQLGPVIIRAPFQPNGSGGSFRADPMNQAELNWFRTVMGSPGILEGVAILAIPLVPGKNDVSFLVNNSDVGVTNYDLKVLVPIREIEPEVIVLDTAFVCEGTLGDVSIEIDTIKSSIGCDSLVLIQPTKVVEFDRSSFLISETKACGEATVVEVSGEGLVNIEMNGELGASYSVFEDSEVWLTVTNELGCSFDTLFDVEVYEPAFIELAKERCRVDSAGRVYLYADASWENISWETGIHTEWLGDLSNRYTMVYEIKESHWVYATVLTRDGCTATDSLFIEMILPEDENEDEETSDAADTLSVKLPVYIPNVFSPNRDGLNDEFRPMWEPGTVETILSFEIYDRWGERVFDRKNIPEDEFSGWDGKFKGEVMGTDVFIYIAHLKFPNGRTCLYKGDITLVR